MVIFFIIAIKILFIFAYVVQWQFQRSPSEFLKIILLQQCLFSKKLVTSEEFGLNKL